MDQMTNALRGEGIALSFGGIKVLKGLDVEFRAGEITGLIEPNGAGKTTLAERIPTILRNGGQALLPSAEMGIGLFGRPGCHLQWRPARPGQPGVIKPLCLQPGLGGVA